MSFSAFPFLLQFPEALMRERIIKWELSGRVVTGGKTLAGPQPVARLDGGGLWMCTMQDVQVSSADNVRAWRAITALMDGGATPIVMSVRDTRFSPWPTINGAIVTEQYESTNSDDSTPSDDTPYVNDVIHAFAVADADLRATTLIIGMGIGAPLAGGEYFSIQHPTHSHRLYRVGKVSKTDSYAGKMAIVTVTIATPGVFTWATHGLVANQAVYFDTTGALPTGLLPYTLYYVLSTDLTTNTFKLAATVGGAAINTTGSQSGVHRGYAGGFSTLTIRPPLREAVDAGTRIEFDYPKCVMMLNTPDAMDLALERRFHGSANVTFIESFPPWL